MSEKDVKLVLLQHPDGRTALERGDVAAWAGLDPMMAAAELEIPRQVVLSQTGSQHLGRPERAEEFAAAHPGIVRKVLTQYEVARKWAVSHKPELIAMDGCRRQTLRRDQRASVCSAPTCPAG